MDLDVDFIISRFLKGDDGRCHFEFLQPLVFWSYMSALGSITLYIPDVVFHLLGMCPAVNKDVLDSSVGQEL